MWQKRFKYVVSCMLVVLPAAAQTFELNQGASQASSAPSGAKKRGKPQVTRFKGLGEMDADELAETTMNPAKRKLLKVQLEDMGEAQRIFTVLMGTKVEPRRDFIERHALEVTNLDI